MLSTIISWSLGHRWQVLAAVAIFAAAGLFALRCLTLDAFPDTTPEQVQINTVAPALVATEVERLITFPVEMLMGGMPGLEKVRSISQFGLSQVTVTFADGTNLYLARQLIAERLSTLDMPPGIPRPELGPVATGLGEVLHYQLVASGPATADLTKLRTAQSWTVRPAMRSVPGSAEINSWGGLEKQYQIRIDPVRLFKFGLTLQQVMDAVRVNNLNVGGGYLDRQGDMLLIHGIGRTSTIPQIESVVIASEQGVPIYLKDVAEIVIGHAIRRGIVTAEGKGEVVLGLGFMRIGENSYEVTRRLRDELDQVARTLPAGIDVVTVYDRTELVGEVIGTVRSNLCDGALLVVVILFLFLGNLRAGLIAAATIPLSMLFAFLGMWPAGIAGTLLSLGAIDFGIVVDSSVVMLENIIRHLEHGIPAGRSRLEVIRAAALEVRTPTVFGQIIIMIVYLPILTLEGVEGKMFRPMALTVMLVLSASLVLALTLTPVLASLVLPARMTEQQAWLVRAARWIYRPCLQFVLTAQARMIVLGLAAVGLAALIAKDFGTEFVPQLSEGAIVIGILRVPGTSLEQSAAMNLQIEKFLREQYPDEVAHVWSRVGEPEINTDAGSPESTDLFVTLHPRERWQKARSQADLVARMSTELKQFKGQIFWFTQPIEMRLNEMLTGSRSDLALKLFGDDIDTLITKSAALERILRDIPGCADLSTEQVMGQPILEVRLNQQQLARYGVPAQVVMDVLETVSGKLIGDVVEDQLRYPLAVRLPERLRNSPDAIAAISIPVPSGERLPLSRLADIREVRGPKLISSEWGRRRVMLQCNVRDRDIGSFVAAAQERIDAEFQLPGGYRLEWGGQFENMVRAQHRLLLVVPLALFLIVGLLYLTYRNIRDTLFVFASVPLACVGGVLALWIRDLPLSISAAVGFITLSGVSVLNSMILTAKLRSPELIGLPISDAIEQACSTCLRTVLMTALVAGVGFIPMAASTGTGAEVQRPLATVIIGGVMSSTLMTLFILPAMHLVAHRRSWRSGVS